MTAPTTTRILAEKALGRPCGQECVDWAIAMLEEGRDGYHLAMLAGKLPPHDTFELVRLRDGALIELGIPEPDGGRAVAAYELECVRALLDVEVGVGAALRVLYDIWMTRDHPDELYDFFLLHWAHVDLCEYKEEQQWYWPDATRENIVAVVRARAEEFLRERGASPP